MRLSPKGPEDWNNVALYWSVIITARKKLKPEQPERYLNSTYLMPLFCIFLYTLCTYTYLLIYFIARVHKVLSNSLHYIDTVYIYRKTKLKNNKI